MVVYAWHRSDAIDRPKRSARYRVVEVFIERFVEIKASLLFFLSRISFIHLSELT